MFLLNIGETASSTVKGSETSGVKTKIEASINDATKAGAVKDRNRRQIDNICDR